MRFGDVSIYLVMAVGTDTMIVDEPVTNVQPGYWPSLILPDGKEGMFDPISVAGNILEMPCTIVRSVFKVMETYPILPGSIMLFRYNKSARLIVDAYRDGSLNPMLENKFREFGITDYTLPKLKSH